MPPDLTVIVARLCQYYRPEEIRAWLLAAHPQLEGARAIDRIRQNQPEDVLRLIDRLDTDVYL